MTELLYYKDAYLKETWAKVLAIEGRKILLEKTIFFPEIAGKPGDTGRVDGIPLLGAVKQDSDVWHVLASDHRLKVGDSALLQLDWKRRNCLMRLHAAIHLVSGVFRRYFRIYPDSNKMAEYTGHIEFAKEVGIQTIGEALEKANNLAKEGAEIDIRTEQSSGKRYVRIGYFPEFPCSGLFVRNIKEIGAITLDSAAMNEGRFVLAIKVE